MTSSNGTIFHVTGHLCGEFTWSAMNSPHKGQWRGALIFSLICVGINDWVNNREAGDSRRYGAHYDVIVMIWIIWIKCRIWHAMRQLAPIAGDICLDTPVKKKIDIVSPQPKVISRVLTQGEYISKKGCSEYPQDALRKWWLQKNNRDGFPPFHTVYLVWLIGEITSGAGNCICGSNNISDHYFTRFGNGHRFYWDT